MVLRCRQQNNPLLVGEVGVGKSAIVRALAHALAAGEGMEARLVAFSLDLLTLTEKPEEGGKRVNALLGEVRRSPKKVLLYLDDLEPLLRVAPTQGAAYLRSAFRAALARHEVQCIALATPQAFRSDLASHSVLARFFRPIFVKPPSPEETLEIVRGARQLYEAHHRVQILDDALPAAIEFSQRYFPERALPGKALQLLDDAGALVRLRLAGPPPNLKALEKQWEQLKQQKERAIARHDFVKAAQLRHQEYQLLKRKEITLRQWQEKSHETTGVVDRSAIAAAVSKITGHQVEGAESTRPD
jgi:ATP-dependent Clp protease ATP-binding subunit ClpC